MRKYLFILPITLLFMFSSSAFSSEYSTTSWEVRNGTLYVSVSWQSEPLTFTGQGNGYLIRGVFPSGTTINLPDGWVLDMPDIELVNVSDSEKIKNADEVDGLEYPAVRIAGSNAITLKASGIYMTAWYIGTSRSNPDYIAAHYQAWYREPRFSSNDSPGVPDNYEYNWTLRQHGNESRIKFFSADKTAGGQGENAGYQYPMINFYDSRDGDVQKWQAATMKIAGIDAVIFDFYGAVDIADYRNPRINSDSFIRNVLDPAGMNYMIFYEEFSAKRRDYTQYEEVSDIEAKERIKKSFSWLKDNWFNRKGYIKYNGRPVVMVFVTKQVFSTRKEWEDIAKEAGVNPPPFFVNHYNSLSDYEASFNWMPVDANFSDSSQRKYFTGEERRKLIDDSFNFFSNISKGKDYIIATAYPGFDDSVFDELDRLHDTGSHNAIGFDDGETFKQTFDLSLSMKPNIIQIGTWNDYNEDTVTEPSTSSLCHRKTEVPRGYSSLEYIQKRKKEWKSSKWNAEDLRAPLELYKLSKSPYVTHEEKERIDEAYKAIFNDDAETFRRLAASLITYDNEVRPVLRAEITQTELKSAEEGEYYSESLNASGTTPMLWTADNLPEGLTCSQNGKISGTLSVNGEFKVKITCSNSAGSVSKILTMKVNQSGSNQNDDGGNQTEKSGGSGGCKTSNIIDVIFPLALIFAYKKSFRKF